MAAILCCAIMGGVVVFLVIYALIHKPQAGDFGLRYSWVDSTPRLAVVAPSSRTPWTAVPRPPPPPRQWHEILSNDHVEQRLLTTLRGAPSDEETRMVYADLLEQRGQLAKADFVRGNRRYITELLESSDADWRAITCRANADCSRPRCPRSWDRFAATDDERLRQCGTCQLAIRYCVSAGIRPEPVPVVFDLAAHSPLDLALMEEDERVTKQRQEDRPEHEIDVFLRRA